MARATMPLRFYGERVAWRLTNPGQFAEWAGMRTRAYALDFARDRVSINPAYVDRRRTCRSRSGGGTYLIRVAGESRAKSSL